MLDVFARIKTVLDYAYDRGNEELISMLKEE